MDRIVERWLNAVVVEEVLAEENLIQVQTGWAGENIH
jgi:hypothetical protein